MLACLGVASEWAGWRCAFDAASGSLQPVPERYCSEDMIEWEMVPAGFEELLTEDWADGRIHRRVVRLLPEDGCMVDNLNAEIEREILPLARSGSLELCADTAGSLSPAAWALDEIFPSSGLWRCETIFSGLGGVPPRARRSDIESIAERTRVALTFDATQGTVLGQVLVWRERSWSQPPLLEVREGGGHICTREDHGMGCV